MNPAQVRMTQRMRDETDLQWNLTVRSGLKLEVRFRQGPVDDGSATIVIEIATCSSTTKAESEWERANHWRPSRSRASRSFLTLMTSSELLTVCMMSLGDWVVLFASPWR